MLKKEAILRFSIKPCPSFSILIPAASIILTSLTCTAAWAKDLEKRPFQPADMQLIKKVGDIALSPDGEWVAYSVTEPDIEKDTNQSHLFMVSWDGETRIQLTHGKDAGESHPRFSPDGKYLAFIAARSENSDEKSDNPADKAQVWLLNRAGGEAERITELAGGVSGFEWSPDSNRLVLVSTDPEMKEVADEGENSAESNASDNKDKKNDTPPPIVIDRYQFKEDVTGYLLDRYSRLYVFDLKTRKETLLTTGPYDSSEPAWGPDGKRIVFTSKREGDPDRNANSDIFVIDAGGNATARKLTSWEGPDHSPAFSPDGSQIAYIQGGSAKYSDYDPGQLAIIPVNGGEASLPTQDVDLDISSPRWSPDGKSVYFLLVDDRIQSLQKIPVPGGKAQRVYPPDNRKGVVRAFRAGANGVVALATFAQQPEEIFRTSDGKALSDHNRELMEQIQWAEVEGFDSIGEDGTRIGSMLLKPPGYRKGEAYPVIAYIHGGPVSQDGFEFDATSQALAAQGYLVVNPNYRGSIGRGRDFSRAIYADWGNLEIQDIHTVMDHLVEQGLADPKRLGIGGWSYGGMSTNYAIASDTRFAAAVSGASIANMITGYGTDQYIRQSENELGLPWESIETYLKISYPFFHADRIKTPTLFMVGEKDFNVPLINSEQMYQALRSLNIPTQLVIYPGQFHTLTKPSYIQDRLERMIEWYAKYLGSAGENPD
jgi:dipeptidyl aminopeptidase/acylaminoacyl peptidase